MHLGSSSSNTYSKIRSAHMQFCPGKVSVSSTAAVAVASGYPLSALGMLCVALVAFSVRRTGGGAPTYGNCNPSANKRRLRRSLFLEEVEGLRYRRAWAHPVLGPLLLALCPLMFPVPAERELRERGIVEGLKKLHSRAARMRRVKRIVVPLPTRPRTSVRSTYTGSRLVFFSFCGAH